MTKITKKTDEKTHFSLSGFTLVELIVVISILAVLGTIAFTSISGYISNSRDSKRISNAALISKGFDIAFAAGTFVNTSKTSTGYNIALVGSGLTMTGYYGVVNDTLLQSIKVMGNDTAVYDGFQEYRYSYFPNEKKCQVLATLENPENARSAFILPSFVNQAFAASGSVGYAFIKGNFTSTGEINNLVVDASMWEVEPIVDGIKTFSGTETLVVGSALALVEAVYVPENGSCGTANGQLFTVTPTSNLCAIGTSTGMLDNGGVVDKWTWGCTGVNGGADTAVNACSADLDTSVNWVFDTDPVNGKFGDGTTNYCTFAP